MEVFHKHVNLGPTIQDEFKMLHLDSVVIVLFPSGLRTFELTTIKLSNMPMMFS